MSQYETPEYLTEDQRQYIKSLGIPVDLDYPGTYWIASISFDSVIWTRMQKYTNDNFLNEPSLKE